jgi:hypothetical protein
MHFPNPNKERVPPRHRILGDSSRRRMEGDPTAHHSLMRVSVGTSREERERGLEEGPEKGKGSNSAKQRTGRKEREGRRSE